MLIGLCGFIGSGKDTFANLLKMEKMSFAHVLKDVVAITFGWRRDLLEGDTEESRKWRETPDAFWSKILCREYTPRMALQETGSKIREIHPDIFMATLHRKIQGKDVVITDCRFPNEIELIHKLGGKIVHVARNLPEWYEDYKNGKDVEHGLHESEIAWIRCKHDYTVSGNLDELSNIASNIKQ